MNNFLECYHKERRACPQCRSDEHIHHEFNGLFDFCNYDYVDMNIASCDKCCWSGIVHELVPAVPNNFVLGEN
jgi:hypothetical protein